MRIEKPSFDSARDVTGLLQAWRKGDLIARDQLVAIVHQELRSRAAAKLRRERKGHLLQPTDLVNEAYLRLAAQNRTDWHDRAHFFAVATQVMRRILVDQARARKAAKRSGGWARVTLGEAAATSDPLEVEILDLDAALTELMAFDRRKGRVAELRFFGGLSLEEAALALDISRATVEREWQIARAWLYRRVTQNPGPEGASTPTGAAAQAPGKAASSPDD